MSLVIHLFGAPRITAGDQEIQVPRRKSRALVYYLAASRQPLLRQQLLALFWPDLPRASALQTLRTTLHGLRRSLGEVLQVQGDQVALGDAAWVDARRFEAQLAQVQDAATMQQALELFRGDFLEGFSLPHAQAFEDWLTVAREHYRRLAVRGWTALAALHEEKRAYHAALESLERALALNPLQEDLQRESIRLLYLAGDRPGAIRRYDDLRRLLDEEMGVPPMVETRNLYDAILTDRLARTPEPSTPPLRRAAARPIPRAAAAPDELPFAGRSLELAALKSLARPYPLALIEGEPGVGKTRLALEFIQACGDLPLVGRGRELEQALPYHPFIEALRGLGDQPAWPLLQAALRQELPEIWLAETARLLPELAAAPGAAAVERPAEEPRLWEGVRRFLLALAGHQPLALLIDDLHWADASTLGLLGYLARQLGGSPIRLLATLRPAAPRSAVAALLQSLTRENRLHRLPLSRLQPADIQAIAARISPLHTQPLADWLYRLSEGNPYILVELLRHARQTGLLNPQGALDLSAISAEPVVPQTIYSLIQSRLRTLSDGARRVLDAAVAQGREFEFEVVAQAAGLSENAALDALDELQAAGLVQPIQGNRLRFDHSLTMEVAYREVGELRHRLLHRRVAEALESLYLDLPEEAAGQLAGQLAQHFAEGKAPQRAVRYALQAGARAAGLAAWSEAADFFELALTGLSGPARLPVLLKLANAYSKAGNYPRACEVLHGALLEAEKAPTHPAQIEQLQLALARNLMPQARFAEVIELAEKLRASGQPESAAAAELLWGTALSLEGAALEDAAAHLHRSLEIWRQTRRDDHASLSQIQFELGNVLAQQGDLPGAVEQYRLALATAEQGGSDFAVEQRILALNNLAYHLHLLGDPAAADHARAGLELAQEKGVLGLQAYLYSTLGEISLAAGDLAAAEVYFQEGLALAQRYTVKERVAGLTANLGLLAARRGETALAVHRLSTALAQADALGTHHLAAQVRLWLAPLLPPEQARQLLAQARAMAEQSGRKRLVEQIERLEREGPSI
jgi:DNA-binding SARP family transcriptional activator